MIACWRCQGGINRTDPVLRVSRMCGKGWLRVLKDCPTSITGTPSILWIRNLKPEFRNGASLALIGMARSWKSRVATSTLSVPAKWFEKTHIGNSSSEPGMAALALRVGMARRTIPSLDEDNASLCPKLQTHD